MHQIINLEFLPDLHKMHGRGSRFSQIEEQHFGIDAFGIAMTKLLKLPGSSIYM